MTVGVTEPGGTAGIPTATDSFDLVLTNPCVTASLDPSDQLTIGDLWGYIYEPAATLHVTAPYDSVSELYSSYYCGNNDFVFLAGNPSWVYVD